MDTGLEKWKYLATSPQVSAVRYWFKIRVALLIQTNGKGLENEP